MRQKAIRDEAAKLIREMGSDALEVAALETLKANRQRNIRLARFKAQVALEVFRQLKKKTATAKVW